MKKVFVYIFIAFSIFSYSQEKMQEKIVRDEYGDKYILYNDGTWEKEEIDPILQELQEKVVVDVIHLTGKRGKSSTVTVRILKEKDDEGKETIKKVTTSTARDSQEEKIASTIVADPKETIDSKNEEEIVTRKKIRESKNRRTFDLRITNNYSKDIKLLTYAIKFKDVYDYVTVDNLNIRDLKQGESRKIKETVTVGNIDSRDYYFDLIYYELEE